MTTGSRVVVIGLGAIGSHLVDHLARDPAVRAITLIDRDRYEPRNRSNQLGVEPGPKAVVQARRLRRLGSKVITAVVGDVEQLPVGVLRADLLVSCLDNRRARVHLNQLSRWLGVPWIDTGVLADGGYARVTRTSPDPSAACYLCGWSRRDFDLMEGNWSCAGRPNRSLPPATGVPSSLAGLAAVLAAFEISASLGGSPASDRPEELVVSAERWTALTSRRQLNPRCPADHSRLDVAPEAVGVTTPVRELLTQSARATGPTRSFGVLGARFATQIDCRRCGVSPIRPRLVARGAISLPCDQCGRRATVLGYGLVAALEPAHLEGPAEVATLGELGCRAHDLIVLSGGNTTICYEVRDAA